MIVKSTIFHYSFFPGTKYFQEFFLSAISKSFWVFFQKRKKQPGDFVELNQNKA